MRADAVRHRTTLVEAASRVFASDGIDVPLEAVLKEAKLGRGTLYRHFPHRAALLVATLEHDLQHAAVFVAEGGSQAPFLREFLRMQALTASLFGPALRQVDYERIESAVPALKESVDGLYDAATARAHRSGEMRRDVDIQALKRAVRMVAAGALPDSPHGESEMEEALDLMMVALA